MHQCINRGKDEECQAETVELMFGILMQLSGRGAEAFVRCAQLRTAQDILEEPENIVA